MGGFNPFRRSRRRPGWLLRFIPVSIIIAAALAIVGLFRPFTGETFWQGAAPAQSGPLQYISSFFRSLDDMLPAFRRFFRGEGSGQPTGQAARNPSAVRGRARVIDGDSLRVNGMEIRLHGIDAPELRQTCRDERGHRYACGRRAKAYLRRLVASRDVSCRRVATDRYGRMVALCMVDGEDIGRRMVRDGWAVAFVRYSRHYVGDERMARRARRGLWRGRFIPPATWRRLHRRQR